MNHDEYVTTSGVRHRFCGVPSTTRLEDDNLVRVWPRYDGEYEPAPAPPAEQQKYRVQMDLSNRGRRGAYRKGTPFRARVLAALHGNQWFSRTSVRDYSHMSNVDLKPILDALVSEGVIETRQRWNRTSFAADYRLTPSTR